MKVFWRLCTSGTVAFLEVGGMVSHENPNEHGLNTRAQYLAFGLESILGSGCKGFRHCIGIKHLNTCLRYFITCKTSTGR